MRHLLISILLGLTPVAMGADLTNLLHRTAQGLQGTPYLAQTLEGDTTERVVVNLQAMDCLTFVEQSLALARCLAMKDTCQTCMREELQRIRYRQGIVQGYTSRLHYMNEWILDNMDKGVIQEITIPRVVQQQRKEISFMSKHAHLYPQLCIDSIELDTAAVVRIEQTERLLSQLNYPYIPTALVSDATLGQAIKAGDIIVLMSASPSLDASHVGIATYVKGKLYLLHASSKYKRVITNPLPLEQQVKEGFRIYEGIRILRPLIPQKQKKENK